MVMQTRILKHLTKYNVLSTAQYVFRIGLKRDNAILNAMNNKLLVGGIICVLKRAFDILLSKLKFCGISGKDIALYHSYLDNRHFRTAIYDSDSSNKVSSWAKIRHRVPQGSVLGLLLFFPYIYGLPKI